MSRVDSSQLASNKARKNLSIDRLPENTVAASDAFFPFADGVNNLINAGVSSIIQPGGSVNDDQVIDAANKAGISMVFTGKRHFKHWSLSYLYLYTLYKIKVYLYNKLW